MATAESVKAKLQSLIDTANAATGNEDTDLTTAVSALVAGFGQGGGCDFEVTEGTITPANNTLSLRIPWEKETLPLFYMCVRSDFDNYVTPDNPATTVVLGGIVNFCCGYVRNSASETIKYINIRLTATVDYMGYVAAHAPFVSDAEILDSDGLLAYCNSGLHKWTTDTTYKYYIVDKVVE